MKPLTVRGTMRHYLPEVGFVGTPAASMRCVCSWCKTVIREGIPNALTTHTICPSCTVKLDPENWDALFAADGVAA